ncbi:class I SAM-dependent methyltransferase [Saccharopolyspora mangrovi]|uniref:Class I SAM-dependent methyltransferase n=1 Tax=Saccharopolyspora mangrovi TaxID=3082379 RepID=A0ABU6A6Y4_9PSEU|nr:class I SAM-dependent methyltransferase [Saccharopolyspora sp. S2-29]MEB3367218.1 class I SAM-dependent methyltransferase [Saccharopolyspora sp. S2-29]
MVVNHFGESVAAEYDSAEADMHSPAVLGPAGEFLAGLAGAGAALELGTGTGRVALPLSERGVPVHGIDLSEAGLARMWAKPGTTGSASPQSISPAPGFPHAASSTSPRGARRTGETRCCGWMLFVHIG